MWILWLAILGLTSLGAPAPDAETPASAHRQLGHSAQVRLAAVLADADSIDWIRADAGSVTFRIARTRNAYDVVATTRKGRVVDVEVRDRGMASDERGGLSWLVDAMRETSAVSRLDVDEGGAVTITTSDRTRYRAIPGRGSGGNDVVEARFAAAFDRS